MSNGSASSLTDSASRSESRAKSARRVESDNAVKMRSRVWFWAWSLYLTIRFTIGARYPVSSVRFQKRDVLPAQVRGERPKSNAALQETGQKPLHSPEWVRGTMPVWNIVGALRSDFRNGQMRLVSATVDGWQTHRDLKPTIGLNQSNGEPSLLVSWKETSMLRVLLATTLLIASATVSFGGETKCNGQYGCPTNGSSPPAPKPVCHPDPTCPPGRTCLTICESPR